MSTVTVLAIIDFEAKPSAPLTRIMNQRLDGLASDLQADLDKQLRDAKDCEDLVVYISYNSNYAIRWKVMNDVPNRVEHIVADKCAQLGYIVWKGTDLYKFNL